MQGSDELVYGNLMALRRQVPFNGLIDVQILDLPPFRMFAANDDPVALSYLWLGANGFEPLALAIWAELVRVANGAVLDIGAFSGVYSLAAVSVNKTIRAWAFEPGRLTWSRLMTNLNYNSTLSKRITATPHAVGEKVGLTTMTWDRAATTLSSGGSLVPAENAKHSELVFVQDIDSFCFAEGVRNVSVVKMDVERYEHIALRGMKRILKKDRPAVIVEIDSVRMKEVQTFFAKHKYSGWLIDEKNLSLGDITEGHPTANYLFSPDENTAESLRCAKSAVTALSESRG